MKILTYRNPLGHPRTPPDSSSHSSFGCDLFGLLKETQDLNDFRMMIYVEDNLFSTNVGLNLIHI